jgi:cytochrome c biogenesis protein CcmG/thiol:disulfide interchange protein DsbE
LVGQARPSPEETLSRLVNERLVLRAAESAGLPEADTGQAEAWLANFLAGLKLDDEALEQSLDRVGLTRADLLGEILPRLLQVQQAIESLAPGGDEEAWVSSLRRDAEVVILENVSSSILQDLPGPEPTTQPPGPVVSSPTAVPMGPQVGDQAPDFRLGTMDGSTVRLADLDNHPVILSFWATWCDPCRDELQMLDAIKSEDLIVLPTAVRQPPEQVAAFAADLELDLPLLLDANGQVGESYQVRGLPTSLFVDRQGVVVARHVGPLDQETLDSYLDILMGETPSPSSSP